MQETQHLIILPTKDQTRGRAGRNKTLITLLLFSQIFFSITNRVFILIFCGFRFMSATQVYNEGCEEIPAEQASARTSLIVVPAPVQQLEVPAHVQLSWGLINKCTDLYKGFLMKVRALGFLQTYPIY